MAWPRKPRFCCSPNRRGISADWSMVGRLPARLPVEKTEDIAIPFLGAESATGPLAGDVHGVFTQLEQAADIPQDHCPVGTSGGKSATVLAKGHRPHGVRVAFEGA